MMHTTPQPKGTFDNIEYGASVTYKLTKDKDDKKSLVEVNEFKLSDFKFHEGENEDLSMKTYSFKSYNYSQDYSMLWDLLCENIYTIIYEEYIHRLGIYQINKYDTFDSKYIVKHYTKEEFIKQCQEDELSYIIPNEVSK